MLRRRMVRSGLVLAGAAAVGSLATMSGFARSGRVAPAFVGLDGWINTTTPIMLDGLRGEIVLVNFWTYSCINSRRPMAYLKRWHTEYAVTAVQDEPHAG